MPLVWHESRSHLFYSVIIHVYCGPKSAFSFTRLKTPRVCLRRVTGCPTVGLAHGSSSKFFSSAKRGLEKYLVFSVAKRARELELREPETKSEGLQNEKVYPTLGYPERAKFSFLFWRFHARCIEVPFSSFPLLVCCSPSKQLVLKLVLSSQWNISLITVIKINHFFTFFPLSDSHQRNQRWNTYKD